MANAATYFLDATDVTGRNAEYTGTPFADVDGDGSYGDPYLGCNRAGSCAPGIGIASDNGQCKLSDWTVLDQHEAARDPQDSQQIGGAGFVDRSVVTDWASSGGAEQIGDVPINVADPATGWDDTVSLTIEATGWVVNEVIPAP
jgi:hypothetical protein